MSRAAPALLALLLPLLPAARGDCGLPPTLSFAELVTSLDSYRNGTEVTYRCRPGFIRVGGKSPVITCQDNSTWSQHSEFCVAKQCPAPDIPNGRPIVTDLRLGARVNFTCSAGYRLIGSHSLRCVLDVGSNVRWDGEFPSCEIQCGPPPTIKGAKLSHSGLSESFPIGTKVTYECLQGFLKIPDRSDSIVCLPSLEWSNLPELCGRSCPAPRGLSFGKLSEEDGKRSFYGVGTTVRYVCRDGYDRVPGQDSTRTCLEDFTWSNPPEFCTKKSCGVPESPEHGRVADTTRTLYLDTVHIVCDEGYRLSGKHITCRLKGKDVAWSQLPTCEEVKCPAPVVPHGKKKSGSVAVYSYGETTIVECNPGYSLRGDGDGVIQCAEDNTWKPSVPVCDPVQCEPPPTIRGAKPSHSDHSESFPVGMRVTYKCQEGFHKIPDKSNIIECLPSLEWTKLPELCGRDCAPPPRFSFAELVTSLDSYRIGTEVTYRCRPGFIRVGGKSPVITCQDNSTWSQHSEFCVAKQCPAPDIPNGRPIVTDLRLGARVNFTCSAGYRLIGSHSLRCVLDVGSNVHWDGEFPSCEKILCLPPPEVANGAHSGEGEGYVFGSSVTYTCKSGFSLVGEASIHCTTEDNLHGVWSPAPQCKEVKCPVPVVPHGKKKSGSVAVYSYGDTIIFECNPGYLLRGGGDGVIQCAEDNTWKPSVPICDPVQCGPLPTIRGAKPSASYLSESFPVGTRLTYVCLEGFLKILDRSDTVECLPSLEWTELPVLCGRSCPAPSGLPFGKLSEEDGKRSFYAVGTTVRYVCCKGYYRVPGQDSTRTCLEDFTWSNPPEFCTRLVANSREEAALYKPGNAYKMAFGVLAPVVVGYFVCIPAGAIYQNKKKGRNGVSCMV
ncbi:complement component receptor 1-like protein isoform X2 [Alligator mississippiensis]|uniref:complement component receptor 1-like protein isoform X2 n=1 Tax=Alligator mississippiensis TaxID=8496 RepID=UPI002877F74A|nr:complement component receptor 1-like protein isoform X2 [Alligator mississippiensis]XP_059573667.1 complement component receptor 1-like protein isoform X2 [Alligator mississippiensis]